MMSAIFKTNARTVHVCFDKYQLVSLKNSTRDQRGATEEVYKITGSDQIIRQSGKKLLQSTNFKNELILFLIEEWGKPHYSQYFQGKVLFASHGGRCRKYQKESGHIKISSPSAFQGDHEEADTLVAFHVSKIESDVVVRASDTDIICLLCSIERNPRFSLFVECGNGNSQRYINIKQIVESLDEHQTGVSRVLPALHAFSGSDFTSAFYRLILQSYCVKFYIIIKIIV